MIDSHNEFLADELRTIALIERKKYLGLLKQLNVVLDSQARAFEAGVAQIKKCQDGIAQILTSEEEENLPEALKQVIASGPSLVDKKTGDVEKLEGAGSFIKPYDGALEPREKEREKENDTKPSSPSIPRKDTASAPPPQPAAIKDPAKIEDSLDSYLNALNESASFFTPIKDSDEESESDESSEDDESPPPEKPQPVAGTASVDGDPLQSLLKTFEGDRSVYVDKLN